MVKTMGAIVLVVPLSQGLRLWQAIPVGRVVIVSKRQSSDLFPFPITRSSTLIMNFANGWGAFMLPMVLAD